MKFIQTLLSQPLLLWDLHSSPAKKKKLKKTPLPMNPLLNTVLSKFPFPMEPFALRHSLSLKKKASSPKKVSM